MRTVLEDQTELCFTLWWGWEAQGVGVVGLRVWGRESREGTTVVAWSGDSGDVRAWFSGYMVAWD